MHSALGNVHKTIWISWWLYYHDGLFFFFLNTKIIQSSPAHNPNDWGLDGFVIVGGVVALR